jgi:hypothetical protein
VAEHRRRRASARFHGGTLLEREFGIDVVIRECSVTAARCMPSTATARSAVSAASAR